MKLPYKIFGTLAAMWAGETIRRPFGYHDKPSIAATDEICWLIHHGYLQEKEMHGHRCWQWNVLLTDKGYQVVRDSTYLDLVTASMDRGYVATAVELFRYLSASELCTFLVSRKEYVRDHARWRVRGLLDGTDRSAVTASDHLP